VPGAKVFLGKLVAAASFLEGDLAAFHGGEHRMNIENGKQNGSIPTNRRTSK
jgi:hypothetical protein